MADAVIFIGWDRSIVGQKGLGLGIVTKPGFIFSGSPKTLVFL